MLLVAVLNFVLYKPVLSIIDRRKKQLEELENEVILFRSSVDKKAAEYEEKLKQAKTSAAELKNEIINEGAEQAKQIVDAVRNDIPVMTQEFQQKMEKELVAARQVLQSQSSNLSLEIATKVLGRSVQ
ncbi:MAG: ATP synthase F0 subunit B [Smithellaceae bacterium]